MSNINFIGSKHFNYDDGLTSNWAISSKKIRGVITFAPSNLDDDSGSKLCFFQSTEAYGLVSKDLEEVSSQAINVFGNTTTNIKQTLEVLLPSCVSSNQ